MRCQPVEMELVGVQERIRFFLEISVSCELIFSFKMVGWLPADGFV
jgi:hypothetical protein